MPRRKFFVLTAPAISGLALTALVLAALTMAGCQSQLPMATTYPATGQHKMQAAHHWDVLAADVADQVRASLDERVELRLLPVDVIMENDGPFSEVFENLLTSQLVARGIQVASQREGLLALKTKVQLVRHNKRSQRPKPGVLTVLGAGVSVARHVTEYWLYGAGGAGLLLDVTAGAITNPSSQEIVVTSAMVHKNRFVMHRSDIYYINDPDSPQYAKPVPPVGTRRSPQEPFKSKAMGVVND